MAAIYEVRLFTRAGVPVYRVQGNTQYGANGDNAGFLALSYTKGVNEVGSAGIVFPADAAAILALESAGTLTLDAQVEIWRADLDNGIDWYCDFYGFFRDREYSTDDNGVTYFTAFLAEQSDYLRRACVGYRANVDGRSAFDADATETILKNLVKYNATASGTTGDGRDRNVDAWGGYISVAADGAGGATQTVSCMGRNLLEVLREVAEAGGLDFSLVKTGAQTWEFRTDTTLGDDRTNDVVFALQYGNMRRPTLRSNRRAERTVVIAGGQGQDTARTVAVRTGTNYNATWNSYEVFWNASQYSTTAGLEDSADARLEELKAREELIFDVIQAGKLYGKDYFLGDLVTAYYREYVYAPQIRSVTVSVRVENSVIEDIQVVAANA